MVKPVAIGGHVVGPGAPCLILAEAGVNHNGSVETACRLVEEAKRAGADAVKFQTFTADALVSPDAPKAEYQRRATGAGESQADMLRALELSEANHRAILACCRRWDILFLSTPFDAGSADLLDRLGVPAFKIGSGDLTNLPFLDYVARKRKPMLLSTGMADLAEVEAAVAAVRATGNADLVLLHCVSNYPAAPADVNLRAMHTMSAAFGAPVGYSDHTLGQEVALAAVALGATVLEKHFTLSRALPGPDHQASIEPDAFRHLVRSVRTVEDALGDGRKVPAASEGPTAAVARRSLVASADIPAGAVVTAELIAIKRPGTGLPPSMHDRVIGRTARVPIASGTLIRLEMLA